MIFDVAAGGVIICVCTLLLKQLGAKWMPVLVALAFCLLVSISFSELFSVISEIKDMQILSSAEKCVKAAIKIVGVGYLFGISADICRTLGEEMVAKGVEIGGRVEIMLIIFPFFKEIIQIGVELVG